MSGSIWWMRRLGVLEDPDRLLLLEHLQSAVLVRRRDQDLDELLVSGASPVSSSTGRFSAITRRRTLTSDRRRRPFS